MILFENFKNIESICRDHDIEDYTINSDGSIDVDGNVFLRGMNLTKLPIKFNKVLGYFDCSENQLTTLEGSPKEVNMDFDCSENKLTSLEECPEKVDGIFDCGFNQLTTLEGDLKELNGDYYCHNNKLTSLKGCPEKVRSLYCGNNKLTSLKGGPKKVNNFYCSHNKLTTLEGGPEKVLGQFDCSGNPVNRIIKLFKDFNEFKSLLEDYNYLRGTRIIRARFEQACLEAGIKMPKEINGYDII